MHFERLTEDELRTLHTLQLQTDHPARIVQAKSKRYLHAAQRPFDSNVSYALFLIPAMEPDKPIIYRSWQQNDS